MAYREIDHTADVGLKITADSLAALFSEAAAGMFSLIVSAPTAGPAGTRNIRVAAGDREGLLVGWLRELLYLWHTENRRFRSVLDWEMTDTTIAATVRVDRCDPAKWVRHNDIKAVTYHQISVATDGTRWRAQVIFDV
jgi:SHS2 domain-containing protein